MDTHPGTACKKPCLNTRALLPALVIAIYSWLFDAGLNGMLFASYYTDPAVTKLMRSPAELQQNLPLCIALHLIVAYLVTRFYFGFRRRVPVGAVGTSMCPYRKSLGFGLWIGLLIGTNHAMAYIFQPIPGKLALLWFFNDFIKWGAAGLILSVLYKPTPEVPTV